ncbi:c-type cytochrome [Aquifex sp.]
MKIKYLLLSGLMLGLVACEQAPKQEEAPKQEQKQEQKVEQKAEQKTEQKAQEVKQEAKKEEAKQEAQKQEAQKQVAQASGGALGNPDKGKAIFNAKGCGACHQPTAESVGPSLKRIAQAYAGKEDQLVKFLKGEAPAIVDPAKFAIMKPQLGQIKDLSDQELRDLAAYMMSYK